MSDNSGFQVGTRAPHFYERHARLFMAPFVDALVSAVVQPGDAVLDVACGTGFAARAASIRVGVGGRVVGSDVNPAMIALAQSIPHAGACEISWRQASALDLPFDDDGFDAVVCQQGVQFFPGTSKGLEEMSRVLRKGGRLGATVWAARELSPYIDASLALLSERCGGDAIASAQIFAESEDLVQDWFTEAGHRSISIDLIEAEIPMPPIAVFAPDHFKAQPPNLVGDFFDRSDEEQRQLMAVLEDRLSDYRVDQGFKIPFRSYLVTTTI